MRRVATVRLAADSTALVRRGALLLEDALRTASFPEAGPGRVLLIRTLPVGVIHGHLPPATLALNLERRVRQLAVAAVHAAEPSAARSDAVFFRDDAEPPAALAGRLARGEPVHAWFWPLAVPGFHPGKPREEALRLTLSAALQTSAGPAAVVRLVEALQADGGLAVLLDALRWQEGPALLRAFGGPVPDAVLPTGLIPADAPEAALPSASLRATVTRWVGQWGERDARSVWLTAVALVLQRRGRLVDVRLPDRAARLAAQLASGPAQSRTRVSGPPGTPSQPARDFGPAEAAPPAIPLRARAAQPPAPSLVPQSPELPLEAPGLTPSKAPPSAAPTMASDSREATAPGADSTSTTARGPITADRPPLAHSPLERDVSSEASSSPAAEWLEVPRATVLGGLLFLIPVLERLGMAALLDEHPALLELELPERLFGFIAERLGAPVTDPSRVIFQLPATEPRPVRCRFELPESLRASVASEGALLAFPSEQSGERTVLTDTSTRLPLAVTYGVAPAPESLGHGRVLSPALSTEDDLSLLLRSLLTAVRRSCRRHARLGLADLARRPGRIAATRTHLDVVFDVQQTDLRVRRLGLDVDPGWVPWLGRVVRFHYLHGEA